MAPIRRADIQRPDARPDQGPLRGRPPTAGGGAPTEPPGEKAPQGGPASSRYARHTSDPTSRDRKDIYSRDARTTIRRGTNTPRERPRLGVVNLETGEITDGPQESRPRLVDVTG